MESFKMLEKDVNATFNQLSPVQGYPGDKFSECIDKIEGTKIFEEKKQQIGRSKF
jgi:hypothetical protein